MTFIAATAALFSSGIPCPADELPRLQVSITKKTIVRPALRTAAGDERGRIQTLVLVAQNRSIRSLPEGSVAWVAVVRKPFSGSYKYSGLGTLAPMLSFQSAELQIGAFEVDARQTGTTVERDRIDYEVVISHDGKETYRTTSVSNFAAVAEAAQPMGTQEGARAGDVPKGENPPPAKPMSPAPAEPGKMPQPPALPIAEVAKRPGEAAPDAPPIPQRPFDFFNLDGKKSPDAK